jgi:pilus assembly protein Flp/PilA
MKKLIQRFLHEEEGQDLVEYALLLALIAISLVVAIQTLRTAIAGRFQAASSTLDSAS